MERLYNMEPITSFSGRYHFLSNFYPAETMYDGILYPTSEHAYQAAKTNIETERKKILFAETPGKAKRMGREIPLRDNWDKIKINVMRKILESKFRDSELLSQLKNTAPLELIEGNTWGDRFWGQCPLGKGNNHLGKLLMGLRDGLVDKIGP